MKRSLVTIVTKRAIKMKKEERRIGMETETRSNIGNRQSTFDNHYFIILFGFRNPALHD
jgi:hypothetical protein